MPKTVQNLTFYFSQEKFDRLIAAAAAQPFNGLFFELIIDELGQALIKVTGNLPNGGNGDDPGEFALPTPPGNVPPTFPPPPAK
jgi:hypothetical protein